MCQECKHKSVENKFNVASLVILVCWAFNSLPNNKILDWSILKAFADNKINVTKNLKFVFGRLGKWWEKNKILVTSIFSFSHIVFKSPS